VIAANSIKVFLCPQAAPTPVISYGITDKKAGGAIIITASHNPGQWNGFKVKSPDGASAPTEVITEIEKNVARLFPAGQVVKIPLQEAVKSGTIQYFDIMPEYKSRLQSLADIEELKKSKLK